jgi:hypothetical protein
MLCDTCLMPMTRNHNLNTHTHHTRKKSIADGEQTLTTKQQLDNRKVCTVVLIEGRPIVSDHMMIPYHFSPLIFDAFPFTAHT